MPAILALLRLIVAIAAIRIAVVASIRRNLVVWPAHVGFVRGPFGWLFAIVPLFAIASTTLPLKNVRHT